MKKDRLKHTLQKILDIAKVNINRNNPSDIQVHDDRFYQKVLAEGSLGLGESYMEGLWDCNELDGFFYKILKADLGERAKKGGLFWDILRSKIINLQDKSKAFGIGEKHYDIGNELFQKMLDKRMVYTCGYWRDTDNLDDAQESKLELVCKKVRLKKRMKILDIGCGWGSFGKYAAENYGVEVVGITVSKEQVKLGNELCRGLPVEIRLQDYRDLNKKFDAIVSLGMFEHVGLKNYRTYMEIANKCLKDEGLFLLHTIGKNESTSLGDPWMDKYIFPNARLPSVKQIGDAIEKLFVLEDWHSFGQDYDKTLMAWHENFNKNWNNLKKDYDEKFKRMWDYYLLSCAGSFRARKNQLWQIVLSKNGIKNGYTSIR